MRIRRWIERTRIRKIEKERNLRKQSEKITRERQMIHRSRKKKVREDEQTER